MIKSFTALEGELKIFTAKISTVDDINTKFNKANWLVIALFISAIGVVVFKG